MNDLFEWKPSRSLSADEAIVAAQAAPPKTMRLELYDNGPDCKAPKTQWGLVLDCNNSQQRFNINYGVQTHAEIERYSESAKCTPDEYRTLRAMLDRWYDAQLYESPKALMATAKQNGLAGTGQHNLQSGNKGHIYTVAAILITPAPFLPPVVVLYVGGEELVLGEGWERVKHSSNPAKVWQVRF